MKARRAVARRERMCSAVLPGSVDGVLDLLREQAADELRLKQVRAEPGRAVADDSPSIERGVQRLRVGRTKRNRRVLRFHRETRRAGGTEDEYRVARGQMPKVARDISEERNDRRQIRLRLGGGPRQRGRTPPVAGGE